MALALSLHFDDTTSDVVRRIWQDLADSGVSSDMLSLQYPPHLTLLVIQDERFEPVLGSALGDLAAVAPGEVLLGNVSTFAQSEVAYIGCEGDQEQLFALHRLASALLPSDVVDPHYRTANWTPHVTLQTSGNVDRAMDLARGRWRPQQTATTTRLELATFLPVRVRQGIALG